MNRSGIKRGLAVTAISALALAGAPFLVGSASAAPNVTATTVLQSPTGTQGASTNPDGQNSTISLVASAPAATTSVTFTYGAGNPIGSAGRDTNGLFQLEWNPPASLFGTTVNITAAGNNAGGTDIEAVAVSSTADTLEFSPPPGTGVGFYTPAGGTTGTAIVSGTTSSLVAAPNATFKTVINGPAANTGTAVYAPVTAGATSRAFTASVPVSVAALSDPSPTLNQFAVQGNITTSSAPPATSGDAQGYNAYKQTINGLTATATPATVPTVPANSTTTVVVTVTDQNQKPIAGAFVRTSTPTTGGTTANAVTNSLGQVTFTGVGAGTSRYYADDNNNSALDANEFFKDVTVTAVNQTVTSVVSKSADGAAFDTDEYQSGDITAQVLDQSQTGINGVTVSYQYSFLAFPTVAVPSPTAVTSTIQQATTATVGTTPGIAVLAFPPTFTTPPANLDGTYTLTSYIEKDGTPGPTAGDLSGTALTFKRGTAALAFTPQADGATGTTSTYTATLKLADGTGLAGRVINFAYSAAAGGNSVFATTQPTGTTRTSDTAATGTTDSTGTVKVAITDPATPATAEQGGTLTAVTTNTPNIGNANANAQTTVNFSIASVPAGTTISFDNPSESSKPGVPTATRTLSLTAPTGATQASIVGVAVTLVTTNGFFTPTTDTFDPAAAAGANAGEYSSLGKSITVTTVPGPLVGGKFTATATFRTTIERDAGFDDDGVVVSTVTATVTGATAATATDNYSTDYTTVPGNAPLNGGKVDLVFSDTITQTTTNLPKAQTVDHVLVDIVATDQFGNKVGGAPVALTNTAGTLGTASVTAPLPLPSTTVKSDYDTTGEFTINTTAAGDVTVTGTWTAPTTTFGVVAPPAAPTVVTGTKSLTDSITVNFYAIDFSQSKFALKHVGANVRNVGATVVDTYAAVDQLNQPIANIFVQFFRSGPDKNQNGESVQASGFLGEDGQLTYVYQGAVPGKATVTAVPRDGGAQGNVVGGGTKTDTVTFTAPTVPGASLNISGRNSSNKKQDIITVSVVTSASSAGSITLYRVVDGKNQLIATRSGAKKAVTFIVTDQNAGKATQYVAILKAGPTQAAQKAVIQN